MYTMSSNCGGDKMTTVKSTINLSKYYKEQLEYFVSIKELGSVTEGINLAIAEFVKTKQKALYADRMRQAAQDSEFMQRTVSCQNDFERIDADTLSEVSEW